MVSRFQRSMPVDLTQRASVASRSLRLRIPEQGRVERRQRQLALIAALGEHQGLRRAAIALGLTQPAATKLLREIENTLGARFSAKIDPALMLPTFQGMVLVKA